MFREGAERSDFRRVCCDAVAVPVPVSLQNPSPMPESGRDPGMRKTWSCPHVTQQKWRFMIWLSRFIVPGARTFFRRNRPGADSRPTALSAEIRSQFRISPLPGVLFPLREEQRPVRRRQPLSGNGNGTGFPSDSATGSSGRCGNGDSGVFWAGREKALCSSVSGDMGCWECFCSSDSASMTHRFSSSLRMPGAAFAPSSSAFSARAFSGCATISPSGRRAPAFRPESPM